jgi:ABC-type nitrate/sulfonate/bicarbonate transport system substrate-binding protein
MQRYGLSAFLGLAGLALAFATPAAAQNKLSIVTFSGATNLPVWIALDKGFFKKEGLDVQHEVTRGSQAVMEGLMSGKYHFGSAALDNTIAYTEGQGDVKIDNFDLVAILGVHSGMSRIVSRPEIKSWQDLKGKVVAVDAANSGYGLVMYKLLEMNGLKKDRDYTVLAVGSGRERVAALKEGKAFAAAVSPPEDTHIKKEGYNVLADATEVIGSYQGSAYVVRRAWAKENEKDVLAFIRAMVAASDYVFSNKADAIAVMKTRIKGISDEEAETIYMAMTSGKGGLNKGAKVNDAGVKMLLDLRNEFSGSDKKLTDTKKYVDTTYYDKAMKK